MPHSPTCHRMIIQRPAYVCPVATICTVHKYHVQGSVHHKYTCMSIIVQQDANMYSSFISVNCSTCFGWYLHSSSGVHVTVSTADRYCNLSLTLMSDAIDTVIWAPDDGWRYHPKHVEQFTDINKLYIVAYCWTVIDVYSWCTDPWT
jgi:hypothetical protein